MIITYKAKPEPSIHAPMDGAEDGLQRRKKANYYKHCHQRHCHDRACDRKGYPCRSFHLQVLIPHARVIGLASEGSPTDH